MNSAAYKLTMDFIRLCCSHYTILLILPCMIVMGALIRRYLFVRSLSWIPGPLGLPILGNSLSLTGGQVEFFRILMKGAREYGSIFKLWIGVRPFVFITSAEYAQPILSSKLHTDKSYEYKFLDPWLGSGLVTSNGSKWHERRKLLTPTFHYSILEEFIEPIIEQSHILIECLSRKIGQPAFNALGFTKLCALDVICVTAMGKCVNAQLNEDHKYVQAVDGMNEIVQRRFITPWLKSEFIFRRSPMWKKQSECVRVINEFVGTVIQEKKKELQLNVAPPTENKKKNRALLELLLLNTNGHILTDEELRDEVNTFMFAGHDTTSVAIGWCLYVLGKHPDVQEKIIDEYKNMVESDPPTYKEIQKLEYLESVIKEVMRLYPAVPLIARDIKTDVPMGDDKFIIPGVTALVFIPSLHRDPLYFPSPNDFQPERFLNKSKHIENPFAYIPFSAGPRNCIGSKFAMIEMKIIVHAILKNFIVKSIQGEEDLHLYPEIVLLNQGGIQIEVQKRI